MGKIKLLPDDLAHKIAAGEVVERPASVVKELVENALDAKATRIEIEIKDGGKEYIRVTDDGTGIEEEDLETAFMRHATSKLHTIEDLFYIKTLGFRGEALPSIASVSRLVLKTRSHTAVSGFTVRIIDGEFHKEPAGIPAGTTVEVSQLFYNTPARYKFLKTSSTERRYVVELVTQISLAHPFVAFSLVCDGKRVLSTDGKGELRGAIASVYGHSISKKVLPVDYQADWGRINGFIGLPELARGNRSMQTIVLNGRVIESSLITNAMEKAYQGILSFRQYPFSILVINVDPSFVDVNVHPSKSQVKFANDQEVYRDILHAVKSGLLGGDLTASVSITPKVEVEHKEKEQLTLEVDTLFEPVTWDKVDALILREDLKETFAPPLAKTIEKVDEPSPVPVSEPINSPMENANQVRDQLLNGRIIGQLHQTYILLETEFGLWLLDQHIVHERILFEKLINRTEPIAVQQMLPQLLDFSPQDFELIKEKVEVLETLGIPLEPWGTHSFLLRGLPQGFGHIKGEWEKDILEIAQNLETEDKWTAKTAITLACKGAIKAGEYLEQRQMDVLLKQLASTENPFTCPHGRPIIVRLDNDEIQRRFGRK